MLDLIIKNGTLVDGVSDHSPKIADVGVLKDKIIDIGDLRAVKAKQTIEAKGLIVAPGFIDVQNHSDSYWTILDHPRQESLLLQGITSIFMGHCGASLAPLTTIDSLKAVQKWHSLEGKNLNWQSFDSYLNSLSALELGPNVGSFVGHSTMRRGLMGDAVRKITSAELKMLQKMTEESLQNGAFGMSLGLVYSHEFNTSFEEIVALSKIVKRFNRSISVHLRSEREHILESLDEMIRLAEEVEVKTKISHLKILGEKNQPLFEQMLEKIERAYQKGVKISFDVYPYVTSWSVLYTYLPKWAVEGGREGLIARLKQPYQRKKISDNLKEQDTGISHLIIATATSAPHLIGRSIGDIAANQALSAEETALNLLSATDSEIMVFDQGIDAEKLWKLIQHPLSMVATDGAGFDLNESQKTVNLVHPRCFGAMPRFISTVLKKNLMSPERMIEKITRLPATFLGLVDRGVIRPQAKADITVFDPEKIKDAATISDPFRPSKGIEYVFINGKPAVARGKIIGNKTGRVLRA